MRLPAQARGTWQGFKPSGGLGLSRDKSGIKEKKMETTLVSWGHIGIGKENGRYVLGYRYCLGLAGGK